MTVVKQSATGQVTLTQLGGMMSSPTVALTTKISADICSAVLSARMVFPMHSVGSICPGVPVPSSEKNPIQKPLQGMPLGIVRKINFSLTSFKRKCGRITHYQFPLLSLIRILIEARIEKSISAGNRFRRLKRLLEQLCSGGKRKNELLTKLPLRQLILSAK